MENDKFERLLICENDGSVNIYTAPELISSNTLDQIYEESSTAASFSKLVLRSIVTTFFLVFVAGTLVSSISMAFIYVDLNFMNQCYGVAWGNIPHPKQVAHIFSHSLCVQLFLLWYVINFCLVFQLKGKKVLILMNLLAGCLCTIYRLTRYVLHIYDETSALVIPKYLIYALMMFASSWLVASQYCWKRVEKVKLCFKLNLQFIFAFVIDLLYRYKFFPLYLTSNGTLKLVLAGAIPFLGFCARFITQQILLKAHICSHAGNLYILYSSLYAITILFYRTLQANVESATSFLMLTALHGFTSFAERMAAVYGRRVAATMIFTLTKRDYGEVRTPKVKRVIADSVIIGIILEVWGILVTNCIMLVYALLHRIPLKHGDTFHMTDHWEAFLFKISLGVLVEYFFICLAVLILTIHSNMPINRIWWRNWKRIILTIMINTLFATLLLSPELSSFTKKSYHDYLSKRGDQLLADKLYYCNVTQS